MEKSHLVIKIYGGGCATGKLIDATEHIIKDAKIIYQNVWIIRI